MVSEENETQRVDKQRVLSAEEMILVTVALVDTIAAIHAHKPNPICHGDIKSDNILKIIYGGENTVRYKLTDFGSAFAVIDDNQLSTSPLTDGSHNFMSAKTKKYLCGMDMKPASLAEDIWALGATLLNLATGFYFWDRRVLNNNDEIAQSTAAAATDEAT